MPGVRVATEEQAEGELTAVASMGWSAIDFKPSLNQRLSGGAVEGRLQVGLARCIALGPAVELLVDKRPGDETEPLRANFRRGLGVP